MSGASADQPRTLVIVNPASAGGRTLKRWPALHQVLNAAGIQHDVHHTTAPVDATTATRSALGGGYTRVVAAGGDGTLNEVVNGFFSVDGVALNQDAILGFLPSGTGADFRRSVGLPTNPVEVAAILRANRIRQIDAGRVTYDDPATPARQFINIADCGVGGEVVARVNRSRSKGGGLRGAVIFLGISIQALTTFGGRPVRLTLDGEVIEKEIQNVVVANGRYFGAGMRIAPNAQLDDGLFDVIVLPALGRLRTLAAMPSVYRGKHLRQTGVLVRRAVRVRVEPLDDRPLLFDIEGEQIGRAPAMLTCLPGVLNVCVGTADDGAV